MNIVIIVMSGSSSACVSWRIQSSNESRLTARIVTPAADSDPRTPKNFSFGFTRLTITSDDSWKPSIMFLTQFNEHAVPRRRMQKRDAAAMRPRHRMLIDQSIPLGLESREVRFDV